ncbi:hypothetical protein LCGC14_2789130 [marine sediment metagenome]|uniref:Uncharacterized protein n=1 Tax=marine sediment metagenome TaxID=412755 RepID=A0A0F9BHH7_9ZZZZ
MNEQDKIKEAFIAGCQYACKTPPDDWDQEEGWQQYLECQHDWAYEGEHYGTCKKCGVDALDSNQHPLFLEE